MADSRKKSTQRLREKFHPGLLDNVQPPKLQFGGDSGITHVLDSLKQGTRGVSPMKEVLTFCGITTKMCRGKEKGVRLYLLSVEQFV